MLWRRSVRQSWASWCPQTESSWREEFWGAMCIGHSRSAAQIHGRTSPGCVCSRRCVCCQIYFVKSQPCIWVTGRTDKRSVKSSHSKRPKRRAKNEKSRRILTYFWKSLSVIYATVPLSTQLGCLLRASISSCASVWVVSSAGSSSSRMLQKSWIHGAHFYAWSR